MKAFRQLSKLQRSIYLTSLITLFFVAPIIFYLVLFTNVPLTNLIIIALTQYVLFGCFLFFYIEVYINKKMKQVLKQFIKDKMSGVVSNNKLQHADIFTSAMKHMNIDQKLEIAYLKQQDNYRRSFLGNVSHELKTPLFSAQSYVLTLLENVIEDEARKTKYLERTQNAIERLIHIVNDLDVLAKLESEDVQLNKTNFNFIELLQNTIDLLEIKAADKQIQINILSYHLTNVFVFADKEKIQQACTNLIENAIKYGKQKGSIQIKIESHTPIKIKVKFIDNGKGIAPEHLPRIFERFYRVDKSGSRSEGGTGLGLAITKHVLEAHGEKILAKSTLGVGTEFVFKLQKKSIIK